MFAEHDAVNLVRADAFFAGQHQITDLKPCIQRNLGIVENGPAGHREPIAIALVALIDLASLAMSYLCARLADPVKRAGFQRKYSITTASSAGNLAVRPALANQIFAALLIGSIG